jgi:acetyl esterase/lipase
VAGSKDDLLGYFKVVASHGYVVVAPRYALAPEHRYPTPPRQVMRALAYLREHAGRLGIDPDRIALAGDSAGAHIAAQLAALATTPGYSDAVGVVSTIRGDQLRAAVLVCGPYDVRLARAESSEIGPELVQLVLWAYSGRRHALRDASFASWSIVDNLSPAFPPALVTVGNADPLRAHSEHLVTALRAQGVDTETVFFPDSQQPPLNHEYQFDLDSDAGQLFLERLLRFLRERLA